MPVYSLRPIDPEAPEWRVSKHRDHCLVNEKSERAAREAVAREFVEAENERATSPWMDPDKVSCGDSAHMSGDDVPLGCVMVPTKKR